MWEKKSRYESWWWVMKDGAVNKNIQTTSILSSLPLAIRFSRSVLHHIKDTLVSFFLDLKWEKFDNNQHGNEIQESYFAAGNLHKNTVNLFSSLSWLHPFV